MKNISKSLLAASVSIGLFISSAHGAGFALVEQSVSGLGTSFAGAAASAEDASTVFFNPAGMMALDKGASLVGALHSIQPSTEFTDSGLSTAGGTDGGDAGVSAVVPNLYYVAEASGDMRFGIGIGAPFGLATEYDDGWKGRYYGLESALQTVNINPALAFKAHDKLSIGVGLNVQYANATLSSAVNGAGLCGYLQSIGVIPGGCAAPTDIDAEVTGDSIDWGVNYGMLYSMSDATRIGFHYRSGVRHVLKGDAEFTGTAPELAAAGFLVDSDAEAVLSLPATAALSVSHKLSPNVTLLGDAMWTNWDQMSELRISYDTGKQGDTVEDLSWKNTGRYSVGMLYGMSDVMTLRAGLALDQSPVPNEEHRSVRVPDADRTWVSLGMGYKLAGGMQLDAAYAHLMVDDADINKVDQLKGTLIGEYEAEVNIFSVQASMPF